MKKGTKKFLFLSVATLAGMYAYNQFVASTSTKKNMLPTKNGSYYSWKQGNVFYTKTGTGDPVLLIHDTNSASSSVEWSKISKRLQKKHTVYTSTSTKKNMLPTKNGSYYSWKQGNVFYTKTGTGDPVLLIHDTNSASSSVEWSKISKRLQKKHTVYTMDLLGCGLSDKPGLSYTNYMYVQLITAFIKDIIKSKTSVVASNLSSSFVIMANQLDASIIDKMIFINPVSFHSMDAMPDQQSKLKQTIINLPLVGTFIYNLLMNPKRIDRQFRFIYYCRPQLISSKTKDAYYEAAHMDNSNGKYLYSSLLGNYMNIDLRHAVKKITKPVSFIISSDIKANYKTAQEYRKLNSNIDITYVSNCKLYPQLENPEKVYQIIENKLSN